MINLISPDHRKSLQYAKSNTILMGYIQIIIPAVLVIAVVVGGLYYFLNLQHDSATEVAAIEQDAATKLLPDQKKAEGLASSMKAIAGVFDSEVLFSVLLEQLGHNMPAGAALNGLAVSTLTADSPVTVTAFITAEEQGVVLLENFRKAAIVKDGNVTLRTIQRLEEDSKYQYSATYEVVLDREAI